MDYMSIEPPPLLHIASEAEFFGISPNAVHPVCIADIQVVARNRQEGDVTDLAKSIETVGLLQPIVLTPNLRLVCGARRLAACKLMEWKEIPASIIPLTALEATLAEIDENFEHKPLTVLEKAEQFGMRKGIYEALHPSKKHGGKRGNQYTGGIKTEEAEKPFCKFVAEKTGLSDTTIQRYVRIGKVPQEARDILRDTPFADSMNDLSKLARVKGPHQQQILCATKLASGEADSVPKAKLLVKRQDTLSRICQLPKEGKDYRLILGDFCEVADQIEDGSVDLILCDPPYLKESLWVFDKLGEFAAKKLRNGGSLVAMVGQYHLPQIMNDLGKHLTWHWPLIVTNTGQAAYIQSKRVEVGYKPMLWYTKGTYTGRSMKDVIKGGGVDKNWHEWGQSEDEFSWIIEYLSENGDLVCEPFAGGGTTVAAALKAGRRIIAIDSDSESIEMTLRRVDQVKSEMSKNSQVPVSASTQLDDCACDDDEPMDCTDELLVDAD